MKKTKLILTRAAMMLFALFVAQAAWSQRFFMYRATVTFETTDGRTIVVGCDNEKSESAYKNADDCDNGFVDVAVSNATGKQTFPEDELWETFSGSELMPSIVKIEVPGWLEGNDNAAMSHIFTLQGELLAQWLENENIVINYVNNTYCIGNHYASTESKTPTPVVYISAKARTTFSAPAGTLKEIDGNVNEEPVNIQFAGTELQTDARPGNADHFFVPSGNNVTLTKAIRPIQFGIKPMPLEITVTPKEAYANLYTVFPEDSEFAGQYARYYNGEALSMEDELDVVITTQLPEGYSYSNFSPGMADDTNNAEQGVTKVVGDYGWVKPTRGNVEVDLFTVSYSEEPTGPIHEEVTVKDRTDCFERVMAGPDQYIRIVKVPVNLVISGNVEEVEFDGEEHSVDGFTVDQVTSAIEGLELSEEAARHIPDIVRVDDARAFRTNAGETYMEMNNARFDDDTYCVGEVTYNQGKIIVTPSDDEFIVKIAGNTLTKEWNDEEYTVSGYEQGIDDENALASYFDVTKINFTGTDVATGKEVGKHYMGLAADQFEYTGENFSNVVFLVSDGYVEVVPRLTLVQISGNWTECYYNGAVHTSSGYEVYPMDERLDPSSIVCKLDEWAVQGTEVGEYYSHVTEDDFECTDPHFAPGYSIDQVKLKITYFPATLADNADNTKLIKELCNPMKHGLMATVTLNRTFVKDNTWNTICLPFDVTIADSPLAGADVREMSEAALEDGTLTLNFTEESLTEMKAGKAYIIKWTEGDDLVNPKFVGVEFNDVEEVEELMVEEPFDLGDDQSISFKGTFAPIAFEEDDASVLLVGDNNKLFYPLATATLAAQRAYFQLTGIEAGAPAAVVEEEEGGEGAPVFVLHFGGATNINNMSMDKAANEYFDLSGRRVVEPTKGIYIMNGKKVVIK